MLLLSCLINLFAFVSCLPTELNSSQGSLTEFDYNSAIKSLYYGKLKKADDSKGTVWFDTSSYELALCGFPFIGLYGVTTETSYNFLEELSQLGEIAIDNGYHGDFVYILYHFLYHENLKGTTDVNSRLGIEMVRSLNSEFNKTYDSEKLLGILSKTSSIEGIKSLYEEASCTEVAVETHPYLVIAAQKIYSGYDNYIN